MRRIAAPLLLIAAVVTGCAINPESAPNDIPSERVDVFGEQATGDEAAGTNRIFLLSPIDAGEPQRLRSVLRDVAPSPSALLGSLFAGPNNAERQQQIDTELPSDIELLSARAVGPVLNVDVNDVFDDLTADALRLAIAQIVVTATQIDGIESVDLSINGESRVWPLGNGELTGRPLTPYDYPGLVESSQPAFPGTPTPPAPATTAPASTDS